jgi:uncharacterized protein YdeI (BOF family)
MIYTYRRRQAQRHIFYPMLAIALMSYPASNGFAETATNIRKERTAASYVKGKYGYVTLSGTVSKILDENRFELDYGNGITQIEYDDALRDLFKNIDRKIKAGDKVTVTGKLDNNWFTKREILVSSILHIADNYILLYKRPVAAAGDEVPAIVGVAEPSLFLDGQVALTGIVSRVEYKGSFILRYEEGAIQVNASSIKIPESNRITTGDVVTVYGKINNSFFKSRAIAAETIEKIGVYSRQLPDTP